MHAASDPEQPNTDDSAIEKEMEKTQLEKSKKAIKKGVDKKKKIQCNFERGTLQLIFFKIQLKKFSIKKVKPI